MFGRLVAVSIPWHSFVKHTPVVNAGHTGQRKLPDCVQLEVTCYCMPSAGWNNVLLTVTKIGLQVGVNINAFLQDTCFKNFMLHMPIFVMNKRAVINFRSQKL
jgi:hypothetical protein